MKVLEVEGRRAVVEFNGVKSVVDASLVDVNPGDYVIVHAGMIIAKLDEKEALETLKIWEELLSLSQ